MDSPNDPELAPWRTKFRFDTDQDRVDDLKKLEREMAPLLAKVEKSAKGLRVSDCLLHPVLKPLYCVCRTWKRSWPSTPSGAAAVRQQPRGNSTTTRDSQRQSSDMGLILRATSVRFQRPLVSKQTAQDNERKAVQDFTVMASSLPVRLRPVLLPAIAVGPVLKCAVLCLCGSFGGNPAAPSPSSPSC